MIEVMLRGKAYLTRKMLRLLGKTGGFVEPPHGREESTYTNYPGDNYHDRKEIEGAWLEAERKKAEALIEWHRRRFIC